MITLICISLALLMPISITIGFIIGNRIPFDAQTQESIRLAAVTRKILGEA